MYAIRTPDEWLGVDAFVHGLRLIRASKHERAIFQDRDVAVSMVRLARLHYGSDCALVRINRKG